MDMTGLNGVYSSGLIPSEGLLRNSGVDKQAPGADPHKDDETLKETCSEFESLFIHQLLKGLRETVTPWSDKKTQSGSKDMYTSMVDMNLAKELATGEGIGIGARLYAQLRRTSLEEEGAFDPSTGPLPALQKMASQKVHQKDGLAQRSHVLIASPEE